MRGGGVWSWAESLNNSEIGSTKAQLLLASKLMTYQVTPRLGSVFFSWQAFIHLVQKMWEMTRLATMWALALIDSETVVPKASSTSSSCHCPPSKHIVAPLPSFLKKKALHVLWYQKVDHSSWAVNRTLLPLGVILIVFFSFRTKALVPQLPIGTSTYHASGTTVFENHPKSHI